jgi:hypothetical protein
VSIGCRGERGDLLVGRPQRSVELSAQHDRDPADLEAPPVAGPRVTSTETSMLVAVRFSAPRTPERFIARHDECAAASSSSGLF